MGNNALFLEVRNAPCAGMDGFYRKIEGENPTELAYFFEHETTGDTIHLLRKTTLWRLAIRRNDGAVPLYNKLIADSENGSHTLKNRDWVSFSMVQFEVPLQARPHWGGRGVEVSCPLMCEE